MPFFVFTAAACDFVAVDMEGMERVTTVVCWDKPSESVVVEMQVKETWQEPDLGRNRPSEVVSVETQLEQACQQTEFSWDSAGEVVNVEIQI